MSDRRFNENACTVAAVAELLQRYQPFRIDIILASDLDLRFLCELGMVPDYRSESVSENWELILRYSDAALRQFQRRVLETDRRNTGIVCRLRPKGPLTLQHYRLIGAHAAALKDSLGTFDRKSLETVPDILANSDWGITIDAHQDGKLVGFAQGHCRYAPQLAIFQFCVMSHGIRYLCDHLYAEFLRDIRARQVRACTLGMTIRRGLFEYKAKWGGCALTGPYRQEIWCRADPNVPQFR